VKSTRAPSAAAPLVGILALLSLLLFIHVPSRQAWIRVSLDASHGATFAGVAILIALLLSRKRASATKAAWPDWALYAGAMAICIALGVLTEFVQGLDGRPPSSFDVMTDVAGALAGLSAWALASRPATSGSPAVGDLHLWLVAALGLAGILFVLWQPIRVATAYAQRAAAFPTIAELSKPQGRDFVTTDGLGAAVADIPARWAKHPGERALEIRYDPEHAPAVQIIEPQGDWRAFSYIAVDLINAGPADASLVMRIHDAVHDWSHEDRFNLPLVIPSQTRTTVRIALPVVEAAPASRSMDMARIANVMVFGQPPSAPGSLFVSRIWLE
jgi:hypothetical protein